MPAPALLDAEPVAALVPGTIRPWLRLMRALLAAWRSPRGRRVVTIGFGVSAVAIFVLVGRHFASVGWPLHGADLRLVAAAGALFLSTYAFKALGWQRLFRRHERPQPLTLAAATGASSVTGVALPGRFDDVVRITVVHRLSGRHPGVGTIVLSLFLLGLLDAAALMPFASAAAATSEAALGVRIALAVVAAAGVGAAIIVAGLTRMAAQDRPGRYRLSRWLRRHAPASTRDAWYGALLVAAAWLIRAVALVVLLAALGLGGSFPLAVAFLSGGAASAALPIGPAGAATQAGAGAAVLASAGLGTDAAVAFAAVAQALHILAGAAVVLFTATWRGGRKLRVGLGRSESA
ncbi:MAG: lysylphosphatidylglycerol synthase domain-containing protein [Actinomycetota bacterium]|nr:lysylphosphatidylglycerol synthase domain-containing protein [Actinomycetota bacterium]